MDLDLLWEIVRGLLPSVGVTALFVAVVWAIIRSDASERRARARLEAEEDRRDAAGS